MVISNRQIWNQVKKKLFESERSVRLNDLLEFVRIVSLNDSVGPIGLLIAISGIDLMLMKLLDGANDFRETTMWRSEKRGLRTTDGFVSVLQERFSYSKHVIPLFDTVIDGNEIIERGHGLLPIPQGHIKQRLWSMTIGT